MAEDPIRAKIAAVDSWADVLALKAALTAVLDLCDDPGGPDTWSFTHRGEHGLYAEDVRTAVAAALGVLPVETAEGAAASNPVCEITALAAAPGQSVAALGVLPVEDNQ